MRRAEMWRDAHHLAAACMQRAASSPAVGYQCTSTPEQVPHNPTIPPMPHLHHQPHSHPIPPHTSPTITPSPPSSCPHSHRPTPTPSHSHPTRTPRWAWRGTLSPAFHSTGTVLPITQPASTRNFSTNFSALTSERPPTSLNASAFARQA